MCGVVECIGCVVVYVDVYFEGCGIEFNVVVVLFVVFECYCGVVWLVLILLDCDGVWVCVDVL